MSDSIVDQAKKPLSLNSDSADLAKASPCSNSVQESNTSKTIDEKPSEKTITKNLSKKGLFGDLNADLKNALDSWDTLTEQVSDKLPPDQEQLLEVKRLLGELKSQLDEFIE